MKSIPTLISNGNIELILIQTMVCFLTSCQHNSHETNMIPPQYLNNNRILSIDAIMTESE